MKFVEVAKEELSLYGVEKTSLIQLLSIALNSNQKDMLFHLSSFGIRKLSQMTKGELMLIDGVGENTANKIISIFGIAKQLNESSINKGDFIKSPEDAARVFDYLKFEEQEHFECIYLNTKNMIIHKKRIFTGSLNASIVHPREIFKEAVRISAASFICCHNHPSGNPNPSSEDIHVTKRLYKCGNEMGIELLDHIIIGENDFVSLKETSSAFS